MKVKVTGNYRVIGEWGVNFGPLSDVDAEIPDSGGETLRSLRARGEIRADCFDDSDDAKIFIMPDEGHDEKDGE
jgi:hypothetical protein